MAYNIHVSHIIVLTHNLTTQKRNDTTEELIYIYAYVVRLCLMNWRRYAQVPEVSITKTKKSQKVYKDATEEQQEEQAKLQVSQLEPLGKKQLSCKPSPLSLQNTPSQQPQTSKYDGKTPNQQSFVVCRAQAPKIILLLPCAPKIRLLFRSNSFHLGPQNSSLSRNWTF